MPDRQAEMPDRQAEIHVHQEEIHVHQEEILAAKQENERVEKIKRASISCDSIMTFIAF